MCVCVCTWKQIGARLLRVIHHEPIIIFGVKKKHETKATCNGAARKHVETVISPGGAQLTYSVVIGYVCVCT